MRKLLLATTALVAIQSSAFASNYINLDGTASSGAVKTLTILQDSLNNSNTISGNGNAPGTAFGVRGPWNSVTVNQYGGNEVLSGGIRAAGGSTTASLSATYGAAADDGSQGFNTHSLTIGGTNAPLNPQITISLANTNETPDTDNKNAITDVIDVSGGGTLTYGLTVTGDTNVLANTVSAGGNTTLTEGITASNSNTLANSLTAGTTLGYTLAISGGDSNDVDNAVHATGAVSMSQTLTGGSNAIADVIGGTTPVASYTETLSATGGSNSITNTVDGAGAKTVNVTLARSGNTVTNGMSGSGAQSSALTGDSGTKVNYTLAAGTNIAPLVGGSASSVILSNVIGAASTQGVVNVTQSAAGAALNLTVNGGIFTLGAGGINVTQASANASLTATVTAAANGYAYTVTQ